MFPIQIQYVDTDEIVLVDNPGQIHSGRGFRVLKICYVDS